MSRDKLGETPTTDEFRSEMEMMLHITEKDWVALRALALGDQYPELGIDALISLAQKQRAEWEAAQMSGQKATS